MIYQALSETIFDKMDKVDDSDGNFGGEFSDSFDGFLDCIVRADLNTEGKKPYIKYFFGRFMLGDSNYFRWEYERH